MNIMSHYHINNVTTSTTRVVEGVPLECLVAAQESKRDMGKGLADGGADTCVVDTGWKLLHKTQCSAVIQGFSDDLTKQDVPIVSAATVVDLPTGESVILQEHEALYLPNNKFTILSSTQLRESGVAVYDTAKRHGGLQNIVMDEVEIPLTLKRGLLHIPIRAPTKEDLLTLPILDITSDQPWDLKALDDDDISSNHFRGDSFCSNKVTKLDKVLGTETAIDLNAIVYAVHTACRVRKFASLSQMEISGGY